MKKVLLSVFLLGAFYANAQDQDATMMEQDAMMMDNESGDAFDKWSVEISAGVHKPTRNFAPGYYTNTPSFGQASIGVRYMLTEKFGILADAGYSNIEGDDESLPFKTNNYRLSLQGVLNMGNILGFNEWDNNRLGLLVHAGGGYSINDYDEPNDFENTDKMLHIMGGIRPQLRITNSIAAFADVTAIGNVRQTYTWDGTQLNDVRGVDAFNVQASVGLNFYLGGAEKHADWYSKESDLSGRVDDLDGRLTKVETDLVDTDQDGVADYLDREPNTMSGVAVDTKGRAIDKNNNGIPDEIESSLDQRYSNTNVAGNGIGIKELLDQGYVNVYFKFNSTTPETYSLEAINYLMKYMEANPSANAELIGYADEVGGESYNKTLSENRAKQVYDILVASGVSESRLSYSGNGEDTSVQKSPPARQLVRRVTFRLK